MTRPLFLFACVSVLLTSGACSSEPTDSDSDGGVSGTPAEPVAGAGGKSAGSGGKAGATAACPDGINPSADPKPLSLGLVSGQLVDEQGQPTSAGLVQICGKDICINARVGDNGKLAESVDQEMDTPACKFGDGLTWGKLALPLAGGDTDLGTLTTARLPDFADGTPFTPGTAVSSGGVTLKLDADARVEVDTLTYEDDSQRHFRAVALPEPALSQLAQDFVAGFALAPVDTRICPSPALSLENTGDLPPGTALELFMLGVDVLESWAPYAGWEKVGEGQVSDDGATLEFPEGLPLLTTIGIREKR